MRRSAVALVVVLALASCTEGGKKSATPPADRPGSTTTTGGDAPATATTAPSGGSGSEHAIVLGPDGFGDVSFGAPEAEARQVLTAAFGAPESDDALPPGSCSSGATRSLSWADLHVLFGPDGTGKAALVGWTYGTDDPPATPAGATAEGISPGSPLSQLKAAFGDRVEVTQDEALGAVRFSVQGSRYQLALSGLLTGTADTDTVRALFAGSYCGE
jgi:hypothetical protein